MNAILVWGLSTIQRPLWHISYYLAYVLRNLARRVVILFLLINKGRRLSFLYMQNSIDTNLTATSTPLIKMCFVGCFLLPFQEKRNIMRGAKPIIIRKRSL